MPSLADHGLGPICGGSPEICPDPEWKSGPPDDLHWDGEVIRKVWHDFKPGDRIVWDGDLLTVVEVHTSGRLGGCVRVLEKSHMISFIGDIACDVVREPHRPFPGARIFTTGDACNQPNRGTVVKVDQFDALIWWDEDLGEPESWVSLNNFDGRKWGVICE